MTMIMSLTNALLLLCQALATAATIQHPDSTVLAWNVSEPSPGETVDGTMAVLLDPARLNIKSGGPTLRLAVRARLADVQPAPLGALLFHCGGPGSTRSCITQAQRLDSNISRKYDIWGIDQRGIGDSVPSLECSGAKLPPLGQAAYAVSDFTSCECALPDQTPLHGECFADLDPANETEVVEFFRRTQQRSARCYESERFQLLDPATNETHNFLDWIGTQSLAFDIDAFRRAIGAERMSIYGFSYGTEVGAVYATLFPGNVDRLVVNGNMNSRPSSYDVAAGGAGAQSQVLAKLFAFCAGQPKCPISDGPGEHLDRLLAAIASEAGVTADAGPWGAFRLTPGLLFAYFSQRLADASGASWWQIPDMIARLSVAETQPAATAELLDEFCTALGVATWKSYGVCVGPGQLAESAGGGGDPFLPQSAVLGVDSAGRYLPQQAVRRVGDILRTFGPVGAASFVGCFSAFAFWRPEPAPPAPFGSAAVAPLVVGNLYDPSTNYEWSQLMHYSFPSGSLMTWQGIGHCLSVQTEQDGNAGCVSLLENYLLAGKLPPNGHTCHTNFEPTLWMEDGGSVATVRADVVAGGASRTRVLLPASRKRPTWRSNHGIE